MSKLYHEDIESIIRNDLETNPEVTLVDTVLREGEPIYGFGISGWNRIDSIDIYVSPKDELYIAEELNRFMNGIIPELMPSHKEYFKQGQDRLIFGFLLFDRQIFSFYENHLRRTTVRPYPNEVIIKDILEEKVPYSTNFSITFKDLKKYQPGEPRFLQRLFGKK